MLRFRVLRGIEMGSSEVDLAQLPGIRHETVTRRWTGRRADGLDALPGGRTGRLLGSERFLSNAQSDRITDLILHLREADAAGAEAAVGEVERWLKETYPAIEGRAVEGCKRIRHPM